MKKLRLSSYGYLGSILRTLGVIAILPVLIRSGLLLTPGGVVTVQEAFPENSVPTIPVIAREPVFIAVIPLVFSLITVAGFIKEKFSLLWIGCIGLLITGILFLFSLGIHIAIVGLIALILGFALSRIGAFDNQ